MADTQYDFSGYATKNDIRCADGVTIRRNAFADCDGKTVPLVWQHQHNSPENVIGHALLENREDGLYAYGKFNNSVKGQQSKHLVQNGDIDSLSIYANHLTKSGSDVLHGIIREVSLVIAGANSGARIDFPILAHGDELCEIEDEATIYSGEVINLYENDYFEHADSKSGASNGKTVEDVLKELTEEQQKVVMFLIDQALSAQNKATTTDGVKTAVKHTDIDIDEVLSTMSDEQLELVDLILDNNEEDDEVKHNVFDTQGEVLQHDTITADDMKTIFSRAQKMGSLRDAVNDYIQHDAGNYGITNIDYLFPDAKNVTQTPGFIKRETAWVSAVTQGTKHLPFSKIKSTFADITADEARAKGYTKGKKKLEEVFLLLKRVTSPQTIYKKQKLDRDDIIDITDFNVVTWLRAEMRMMLDEELARAVLIGDGRNALADDKINPDHIRPIYTDDELFTIKTRYSVSATETSDQKAKKFIRNAIKARKDYKGTGSPVLFTTEDMLTDMLLLEDGVGRIIYDSVDKLATTLRVSKIVTVPVMENIKRDDDGNTYFLDGIIVNLSDYAIGADNGGAVSMFDDFDIDYNQEKYLIETRCSGALIVPKSAIVVEHNEVLEAMG